MAGKVTNATPCITPTRRSTTCSRLWSAVDSGTARSWASDRSRIRNRIHKQPKTIRGDLHQSRVYELMPPAGRSYPGCPERTAPSQSAFGSLKVNGFHRPLAMRCQRALTWVRHRVLATDMISRLQFWPGCPASCWSGSTGPGAPPPPST